MLSVNARPSVADADATSSAASRGAREPTKEGRASASARAETEVERLK